MGQYARQRIDVLQPYESERDIFATKVSGEFIYRNGQPVEFPEHEGMFITADS